MMASPLPHYLPYWSESHIEQHDKKIKKHLMSLLREVLVPTLPLLSVELSFFFLEVLKPPSILGWTCAAPSFLKLGRQEEEEEVIKLNHCCDLFSS